VHIYQSDGTVWITHGGIEMGKALHTKMTQCAASVLGIPLDIVCINEASTDKVPNSSPTAASVGSNLYGAAVVDAWRQLMDQLEPLRRELLQQEQEQEMTSRTSVVP
jgi:xanthine dehydrogenase/oxidase